MRCFFTFLVAGVAVALSATGSQAATLNFTGNMISGTESPFLLNGIFSLSATYTESLTETDSVLSASTFSTELAAGGFRNYFKPGAQPGNMDFGKSGNDDILQITSNYRPVGGGDLATLSITFRRAQTSSSLLSLNPTNIAQMLSAGTTYTGTFKQLDSNDNVVATAVLGGTIPVPEPGSIGLLAGLGLVCGRRVWRRRQQKQAAAV